MRMMSGREGLEPICKWCARSTSPPLPSPPFGTEERVPGGRERRRFGPWSGGRALAIMVRTMWSMPWEEFVGKDRGGVADEGEARGHGWIRRDGME